MPALAMTLVEMTLAVAMAGLCKFSMLPSRHRGEMRLPGGCHDHVHQGKLFRQGP